MNEAVTFFAAGTPKAQPRPRATIRGNRAGVYDPGTADAWKASIREALKTVEHTAALLKFTARAQLGDPIRVLILCIMPRPKSHLTHFTTAPRIRSDAPAHWHTCKPDGDNLGKAVLDALNDSGLWRDDAQVAHLTIQKRWANIGEEPGAVIRLKIVMEDWQ